MAKNHVFIRKIEILRTLCFLQLLKLKKIKCAQNFDFPLKKLISCKFYNFFEKSSVPTRTVWCQSILQWQIQLFAYSYSVPIDTSLVKSPFHKVNISDIWGTLMHRLNFWKLVFNCNFFANTFYFWFLLFFGILIRFICLCTICSSSMDTHACLNFWHVLAPQWLVRDFWPIRGESVWPQTNKKP